jgi:ribonucleoside-diphosphate reductase alpha chain
VVSSGLTRGAKLAVVSGRSTAGEPAGKVAGNAPVASNTGSNTAVIRAISSGSAAIAMKPAVHDLQAAISASNEPAAFRRDYEETAAAFEEEAELDALFTDEAAEDTLKAKAEASKLRARSMLQGYTGDECGECGNFTMVRNGTCLKCDTCGSTSGCS